jgi:hypothetical protein
VASSLRLVLGPGDLGVDRLGGADLAREFRRPARILQGQQLLPGGQLEQVDQPAGTVAQQHPDAALRDRLDALYGSTQPAPAPRVIAYPSDPDVAPAWPQVGSTLGAAAFGAPVSARPERGPAGRGSQSRRENHPGHCY